MKNYKINGGKENGGSTITTTMSQEQVADFLEVSGVEVESIEVGYENGYFEKIEYWTGMLIAAVEENHIEYIKYSTKKLEYFVTKQRNFLERK